MPTARGWLVAATGVALWGAGWVFGSSAVEQLGFALVILAIVAVAIVRLGRHDLVVERTVTPLRVPVGHPITVSLKVTNRGRGPAPLVLLEDRLPAGLHGKARFALPGIEPEGHRELSLSVRAAQRGRYEIGPLDVGFIDPFGLARVRGRLGEITTFVVHPRIEQLGMPRDIGERRSAATAALRQPTVAQGEDFFTLREYTEGDDLRKVHWPSTAKRGRYMIRQEETPWHTRATILLDDRAGAHGGVGRTSSFERTVEAAASLVDLYHQYGYGYRVVGAHHQGVPSGRGSEHLSRCLDLLAIVSVAGSGDDDALATRLLELEGGATAEATLVVVAGALGAAEAAALARCKRRYRQITALSFPPHRFAGMPTKARWEGERIAVEVARLLERSGIRSIRLGPDEPLATAWSSARTHGRQGNQVWGRKPELV